MYSWSEQEIDNGSAPLIREKEGPKTPARQVTQGGGGGRKQPK
jgi:hypothetical protein